MEVYTMTVEIIQISYYINGNLNPYYLEYLFGLNSVYISQVYTIYVRIKGLKID